MTINHDIESHAAHYAHAVVPPHIIEAISKHDIFLKNEDEHNWQKINLKPNHTFWGGEPAGGIITKYLNPEIFTLYTDETRNNLIKNYRLVPEPKGNIKVYKKFWAKNVTGNTVPPILAYVDLMNTGDQRNIETASKIYNNVLQNKL